MIREVDPVERVVAVSLGVVDVYLTCVRDGTEVGGCQDEERSLSAGCGTEWRSSSLQKVEAGPADSEWVAKMASEWQSCLPSQLSFAAKQVQQPCRDCFLRNILGDVSMEDESVCMVVGRGRLSLLLFCSCHNGLGPLSNRGFGHISH